MIHLNVPVSTVAPSTAPHVSIRLLLHPTESSGVAKPGKQAVLDLARAAKSICMTSTSQMLKTSDTIHSTRLRNPQAYG